MYLGHASVAAGVSREMLERELATAHPRVVRGGRPSAPGAREADPREQRGMHAPPPDVQRVRRGDRRRMAGERASGAERELVRVLLHRSGYFEQVVERVGPDSFRDPDLRRIFAALVALGAEAGAEAIAGKLDPDRSICSRSCWTRTAASIMPTRRCREVSPCCTSGPWPTG